ncbi:unnamed protein product [Ceratitis capitata]|uniref:(Mediterranean fruit fly) hypothetical protein n=1 Tax=Ceratitis capitata TaxID=7213 RepID=A0A811U9J7_CERCA|nr:unnamed protein product [Ceratitis capitata]
MNTSGIFFDEQFAQIYTHLVQNYVPDFIMEASKHFVYTPWVFSLLGSVVIGLAGILPLIIIPSEEKLKKGGFKDPGESKFLKVLLSFAVGGLLGDVFLHLLPEAWEGEKHSSTGHPSLTSGLWVLSGILIFTIVEKIFSGYTNADEENPQPKCVEIANCLIRRTGGKIPEGHNSSESCAKSCDIEEIPNGCFLREREQKQKDQPKKWLAT